MKREIKHIVSAPLVDMGGFPVYQPLPIEGLDMLDPFLLVHHADQKYEGGKEQKNVGVGPHPHRGFSPITLVFEGAVHHRDSMNNNSIIHAGGTQWMNSGKGVIHSERPTKESAEKGGTMEIIQFWLNTPKRYKMDSPEYFGLEAENTPRVQSDNLTDVRVVSGSQGGVEGPLNGKSEVLILRNIFKEGGRYEFHIPQNFNALIYVLHGMVAVEGHQMTHKQMAVLEGEGTALEVLAKEESSFIILAGEPLNEEVSSYGPFVLSNSSEILQAMNDYQTGKMGYLVEEFDE